MMVSMAVASRSVSNDGAVVTNFSNHEAWVKLIPPRHSSLHLCAATAATTPPTATSSTASTAPARKWLRRICATASASSTTDFLYLLWRQNCDGDLATATAFATASDNRAASGSGRILGVDATDTTATMTTNATASVTLSASGCFSCNACFLVFVTTVIFIFCVMI